MFVYFEYFHSLGFTVVRFRSHYISVMECFVSSSNAPSVREGERERARAKDRAV